MKKYSFLNEAAGGFLGIGKPLAKGNKFRDIVAVLMKWGKTDKATAELAAYTAITTPLPFTATMLSGTMAAMPKTLRAKLIKDLALNPKNAFNTVAKFAKSKKTNTHQLVPSYLSTGMVPTFNTL